jgi:heat shock protein HslJ
VNTIRTAAAIATAAACLAMAAPTATAAPTTAAAAAAAAATPGTAPAAAAAQIKVPKLADLAGKHFDITSWRVGGKARKLAGDHLTAEFSDDGKRLSAYFGCNQISGRVTIFKGRLRAPALAMTKIYCEKTAAQESELVALLGSRPLVQLNGAKLVLSNPGVRLTLTEADEHAMDDHGHG